MEKEILSRLKFMIDSANTRRKDSWDFKLIPNQSKKPLEQAYSECIMWLAVATEWFEKNEKDLLKTNKHSEIECCETCKRPKVIKHNREDITDEYFYLLGIKKIFNCFKHNMALTTVDKIHDELFLTLVDKETQDKTNIIIQQVLWLDIESITNPKAPKYKLQDDSYIENFQNQKTLETLTKAHAILYSLYTQLLNANSPTATESHI